MTTIVAIFLGIVVYILGLLILVPLLSTIEGAPVLLAFCWPPGLALAIVAADHVHKLFFAGRGPASKRAGAVILVCIVGLAGIAAVLWSGQFPGH